jgi:CBS domain-containing protein
VEIEPLITRAILTVKKTDTLRAAAVAMMERGVGSAVVITDGKPSGIITDRDALRVIARGDDPNLISVGDCVKRILKTVTGSIDIVDAASLMRETGFRQLVVIDEHGNLAGVFSMRDLVVGLLEERGVPA